MKVRLAVRLATGVDGEVEIDNDGHLKSMKILTKVLSNRFNTRNNVP